MTMVATRSTVIPCLRYQDAPAAIAWLCDVLGFRRQLVVPSADGTIAHAQLTLDGGMVMLSSAVDSEFGRLMKQPGEIGGAATQTVCLTVADADVIHDRVKSAGVPILFDIVDADYGGRGFTCRDPEGHVWSVGTYDPWQEQGLDQER